MISTGFTANRECKDGQRVRTLIVDDSPLGRETLALFLETSNECEVVGCAHDGQEGVDLTATLHPDLVMMDVRMPILNGWDATRQIKLQPGAPVVILMSAEDSAAYQDAARRAGADGFVAKEEIATALAPLLRRLFSLGHRPCPNSKGSPSV